MASGLDTFLEGLAARDTQASNNVLALRGTNADSAAQANILSRQTGVPGDTIERNLPEASAMFSGQRNAAVVAANPQLTRWYADQRNAASSHDDVAAMSAMSDLLGTNTTAGQVEHRLNVQAVDPGATPFVARAADIRAQQQGHDAVIQADRPASSWGSWARGSITAAAQSGVQTYLGVEKAAEDALPGTFGDLSDQTNADIQASKDKVAATTPVTSSAFGGKVYDALAGTVSFAPVVAAAALGGLPLSAGLAGIEGGFSKYADYRSDDITPGRAALGASGQALIDAGSMALPLHTITSQFGKEGTAKFLSNFLMSDLGGQVIQSTAGDAVDTATEPNATWAQFWKSRPEALESALTNAVVGAGTFGLAHHVIGHLAPVADQMEQATAAKDNAQFMGDVNATADASKLRHRDPESFKQFVDQHTAGTPNENLYLPAEKMRELMQSDAFDPTTWHDVAPDLDDQMSQALATGGDIVLPVSGVAAHLSGTPTWDAIKDDVRLDPAGMSANEAKDFDGSYADIMEQRGNEAAAAFKADQASRAPEQKVYDDVFSQSRQAGYNVRASQAYADLWTQRYATRAERTGTDAWSAYKASNVTIEPDLPASVQGYRKADNLDVVINAMKRGAEPAKPVGDSLLQFISKGGGVEDKGGDIASMGGDDWHREKAFRKRLIRSTDDDPAFAGMGADETSTGHGIDDWGQKAFDAGYFPDLTERPNVSQMLDAIGGELRGEPLHPREDTTATEAHASVTAAADDLRGFLSAHGLDPETASRADIDRVLTEERGSRSLDQSEVTKATPEREASTFRSAREAAKEFQGKPLTNEETGLVATVSRNTLDKMLSRKAADKSTSAADHALAVANADQLFRNASLDHSHDDARGEPTIAAVHRYVAPMVTPDGRLVAAKLTVKETRDADRQNPLYTIETIDVDGNGEARIGAIQPEAQASAPGQGRDVAPPGFSRNVRDRLSGIKRSLDQGERGRIDFYEDGRKVIRLFESRDLSTLLHEGAGHLWLEELRQDAEASPQDSQLRTDWDTVQKWFADNGYHVDPWADIPTDAHEMWARGMERYLMEGKAPTDALSSAFSSFRSWLLRIYQVVQNLRAPISNEIRGVMDRLVATDQALSDAQDQAHSQALFSDAKQAGMTDAEFRDYRETVDGARTEAFDALLYRTMETVRKARTKEWREERGRVREGIAADIANRPEFRALAKMRGKDGDGERVPLDRQSIVDELGADALSLIPKGVPPTVVTEGGVHPDILAEMVGLPNGRELLDRLMGIQQRENELRQVNDKRSALNEAIDELTDETMRHRHGDILSDGSIEEEALAAIHDDKRATVMASELRALARKSGNVPTPWLKAKVWAERVVREGTITEQASAAAMARHQRNEAKAGRDADKAVLAGDREAAFKAKQQQMLAAAMYRAAKEAKDETTKIVKRLGNFAKAKTLKSMDQDYLDRIHSLLEDYDFRPRTAKERAERSSFAKWAEAKLADGEEVYVPPRLADAGNVNFAKMTFEQLTGIDDMIASIAHLGRRKKEMIVAGEKRDFDDMVTRAEDGASILPDRSFTAERNPKPGMVGRFAAALTNIEFMADELDNFDPNGVFNRVLIQSATEAANTKDRLRKSVLEPLANLYHEMAAPDQRRLQERVTVPEFHVVHPDGTSEPTVFRRMELLSIALNTGNDSNLDKLLRGERWTEDRVNAVLDRELTESDWQFVEKAWRQVDSLWPEIARVEREMSGVVPEKIEPRMVSTKFGQVKGGYWPVVYDPTRSLMAQKRFEDDASSMFGQHGKAVATPKGHTVERTDAAAPLMLSLEGVLINHVDRVTTRIAYGRYVRDALKFIRDPRIKALVDRKRGPADYNQLLPWLKGQVNDAKADTIVLAGLDHVLKQSRINATIVGLGLRLTTIFQHISYLTNSAKEIGPQWVARGIGHSVSNLGANSDFVFSRSEEMAGRAESFDQNVRDAFSQMGTRYTGGRIHDAGVRSQEFMQRIAFWGMGQFLMHGVAIPTWLGAYHKGISEGMNETDAAHYGDKVVRRAQGGGRAKDLTAFQRAPEAMRQLGMFYSYFGTMFNQQREAVRAVKRGDYRRAANTAFWVMLAEPVAVSIMKGDLPDDAADPKAWAEWLMSKVFFNLWGGIPGLRDASSAAERVVSGKSPSLSKAIEANPAPVLSGAVAIAKVAEDVVHKARGDEPSDRWLEHAIQAPGYFLGLPTAQPASTINYLYEVGSGTQHPSGPLAVAHGIIKGRQRDQE